ncbi:MAG: dockerin type I repeat-containing protein, partial [Planctomycetota bacterium]
VMCGDANGDETINIADAVYIIDYVFRGGPAPNPLCIGDANGDYTVNVADAVYLINYIFKGGPDPVEDCCP